MKRLLFLALLLTTPVGAQDGASSDLDEVRIHDNFIHHNEHPSEGGHAEGYGVGAYKGARLHIYRNVFDFNRHAIGAGSDTYGYNAEENLILKGGGYHGTWYSRWTHQFDVHGDGCWWSKNLCGDAGIEFHFDRNSFQYMNDNAIKLRGKPAVSVSILRNVFPHENLMGHWDAVQGVDAIQLYTEEHAEIGSGDEANILNTDTFGEYGVCDFDGDHIDDLFLATGATWWFSSSGKYPWSFLNTSSKRKKDLKFGYFDDDDRCDVLTESGGSGRWLISRGGTGGWESLIRWQGGIEPNFQAPLKDVEFGRFDPNDPSYGRRTTHAFWRKPGGEWEVTPLWNPEGWKYIGGSSVPMSELRFGDFTGDGVTDVLAVRHGRWVISESARTEWSPLNPDLGDDGGELFIANMDRDDAKDDLLRLYIIYTPLPQDDQGYDGETAELSWYRSKNGVDRWRLFKQYSFSYHFKHGETTAPRFGFAGRFGTLSGGTLVVDQDRVGHFYSSGSATEVVPADSVSSFAY